MAYLGKVAPLKTGGIRNLLIYTKEVEDKQKKALLNDFSFHWERNNSWIAERKGKIVPEMRICLIDPKELELVSL